MIAVEALRAAIEDVVLPATPRYLLEVDSLFTRLAAQEGAIAGGPGE